MRNGIKSIYDYAGREHYEARDNVHSRITFLEPCFPKLYPPGTYGRGGNNRYWQLRWSDDIPTEEEYSVKQWCMVYADSIYQVITFEDGTEMVVSGEHRAEDMQKLQEYINNDYDNRTEMSRAAQLLDDEMMYEI